MSKCPKSKRAPPRGGGGFREGWTGIARHGRPWPARLATATLGSSIAQITIVRFQLACHIVKVRQSYADRLRWLDQNGAFQLKGLSECAAACVVVTALALGYILGPRSFGLSFSLELDVMSTK